MKALAAILLLFAAPLLRAADGPRYVTPDYEPPKVVYEFFFDHPEKIGPALYWIRALVNPLSKEPYGFAPEFMDIKVVIHGTEIHAVAKENYEQHRESVERMRYYAALGVEFKVCGLAADDFGYAVEDFQEFIDVVPSAFTELVHWQQQGYALISPRIYIRRQPRER